MKKRIINAPTPDIVAMIKRRMPGEFRSRLDLIRIDAIGMIMLPVPDLYFYADAASKSANVVVSEIFGSSRIQIISATLGHVDGGTVSYR